MVLGLTKRTYITHVDRHSADCALVDVLRLQSTVSLPVIGRFLVGQENVAVRITERDSKCPFDWPLASETSSCPLLCGTHPLPRLCSSLLFLEQSITRQSIISIIAAPPTPGSRRPMTAERLRCVPAIRRVTGDSRTGPGTKRGRENQATRLHPASLTANPISVTARSKQGQAHMDGKGARPWNKSRIGEMERVNCSSRRVLCIPLQHTAANLPYDLSSLRTHSGSRDRPNVVSLIIYLSRQAHLDKSAHGQPKQFDISGTTVMLADDACEKSQ